MLPACVLWTAVATTPLWLCSMLGAGFSAAVRSVGLDGAFFGVVRGVQAGGDAPDKAVSPLRSATRTPKGEKRRLETRGCDAVKTGLFIC